MRTGQDWFVVGHDGKLHSGLRLMEWMFATPGMMMLFKQLQRNAIPPLVKPDLLKLIEVVKRTKPMHAGGDGASGKVGGGGGGGGGSLMRAVESLNAAPTVGSCTSSFRRLFVYICPARR